MDNFVPLINVFEKVIDVVDSSAAHLNSLSVRSAQRGGDEREVMLASTIAKQRSELAAAFRQYCERAPEPVRSTWLQYTAETDTRRLLDELQQTQKVSDAVASLDHIDGAIAEVFAISERQQDHPAEAMDACAWAMQSVARQRERRGSALRLAHDV